MPRRRKLQIEEAFAGLTGPQLYNLSKFFASGKPRPMYDPFSSVGTPLVDYKGGKAKPVAVKVPVGLTKAEHKKRTTKRPKPKPTLAVLYEEQVSRRAPPLVGANAPKALRIKNKMLATTIAPMVTLKGASRFSPRNVSYPYKKATNRKNVVKKPLAPRTKTTKLAKQVKELQKAVNVNTAIHTYKQAGTTSIKSLIGRCNHALLDNITVSQLEAATANLRYYDPATPGTLVTANANTGTYARDVFIKSYYSKLLFRNNYQVPVRIKVYYCKVKNDTNETPLATYTTAIADQVINASVDETDLLIHFTEIERVREVWNVDCVLDKTLEPGQEMTTSSKEGPIQFDPSHIDTYTNAYQQTFKGSAYIIRVEGVIGHDTSVATEQTTLLAGVDVEMTRKAVIQYNAGVDLDDIYISDTRIQAFTNGGVCSLKPVADNIAYSIS